MSGDPFLKIDGRNAYVITKTHFGRDSSHLRLADSLADAKRFYGWTRELYVTVKVRRARQSDADLWLQRDEP